MQHGSEGGVPVTLFESIIAATALLVFWHHDHDLRSDAQAAIRLIFIPMYTAAITKGSIIADDETSLKLRKCAQQVFSQHPRLGKSYIQQVYLEPFHNAEREIITCNAYFIPLSLEFHYQWTTKMGSIIIAVEIPPIAACTLFPSCKAAVAMKPTVAKVSKIMCIL